MDQQDRLLAWENCLTALIKLIKAVGYYPCGHPALQAVGEQALQHFLPLLAEGANIQCSIRKDGISVDGATVGEKNSHLLKLAGYLFIRRLQSLVILPDLSARDLAKFAGCLSLHPEELQRRGGLAELLLAQRVASIWTNELDLSAILARREELLAQPPEAEQETIAAPGAQPTTQAPAEEPRLDLAGLLRELSETTTDRRFAELLQQLPGLFWSQLQNSGRPLLHLTLLQLQAATSNPRLEKHRRQALLQTLNQLLTPETLSFFIDTLSNRALPATQREEAVQALLFYQGEVTAPLMNRLSLEADAQIRKNLTETLVRQGSVALPVLLEQLGDERWYVARNAVAILGDIRDPAATGPMKPMLAHQDIRVRRETVRALTRIGGQNATGVLLQLLEGADADLSQQALLSLGAMKNPAAVPALLRLLAQENGSHGPELRRGAIKALGEIGAVEAVTPLIAILARKRFWRPGRHNELRAAAAAALGEIGDETALPALENASSERNETVARAAVQALKQLRK
ncbi:MAG: HEAT repeat domain-containing protein [Trichloromonadaceae bacterium]